jgi:PAS domain S-box-containing protein
MTTSSASALERLRLTMLVPALLGALLVIPDIGTSSARPLAAAGIASALALAAYWVWGFRRGEFRGIGLVPETAALAIALLAAGGVPPLPLFALAFRALYGDRTRSVVRFVLWLTVLVYVAQAHHRFNVSDVVGKSAGLALVAAMMYVLVRTFRRLDRTESRLRAVIEQSTDIVTIVGADLEIRWRGTAVGDHAPRLVEGASFLDLSHPEDQPTVRRLVDEAAAGSIDPNPSVIRMRGPWGEERDVELDIGNRLDDEHIRGFLLTVRDVTERRRLERERHALEALRASDEAARRELARLRERVDAQRERQALEARLQRSQRLESVGHLAGGVAHDFNNLLSAILNYTTLVREDLPPEHDAQLDLQEVEDAARRGARLVKQLLVFSKGQATRPIVLDPNAVIENLEGLLRGSLPSHVALGYALDPAPGTIAADVTNIEQVLVNLVVNARDALEPAGGTITLSTARVELSADERDVAPGAYVCLAVSDDGSGMDEETRQRALEPFFSTKAPGTGTGLGLATVAGIATQAGGWVALDSQPSTGTTVGVHLPAATAGAPVAA